MAFPYLSRTTLPLCFHLSRQFFKQFFLVGLIHISLKTGSNWAIAAAPAFGNDQPNIPVFKDFTLTDCPRFSLLPKPDLSGFHLNYKSNNFEIAHNPPWIFTTQQIIRYHFLCIPRTDDS
jgi:hypothetical protein